MVIVRSWLQAGFTGNWISLDFNGQHRRRHYSTSSKKYFDFSLDKYLEIRFVLLVRRTWFIPLHASGIWYLKNHRRKGGFCKTGWGHHSRSHARQACRYFHYERRRRVISAKPFTHIYSSFPFCGNCMYRPAPLVPCRLPRFRPTPPIFKVPKSVFQVRKIDCFSEPHSTEIFIKKVE